MLLKEYWEHAVKSCCLEITLQKYFMTGDRSISSMYEKLQKFSNVLNNNNNFFKKVRVHTKTGWMKASSLPWIHIHKMDSPFLLQVSTWGVLWFAKDVFLTYWKVQLLLSLSNAEYSCLWICFEDECLRKLTVPFHHSHVSAGEIRYLWHGCERVRGTGV